MKINSKGSVVFLGDADKINDAAEQISDFVIDNEVVEKADIIIYYNDSSIKVLKQGNTQHLAEKLSEILFYNW